jgi:amidophosphoribosyltransferase
MDGLKEECGIVGAYQMGPGKPRNVAPLVVRALVDLQNRGQLSSGLTSYNPQRSRILQTHKGVGTVHEVFHLNESREHRRLMEEYAGCAAIGHNRYATSGEVDTANAQPFERQHGRKFKWFAFGFNGNLANYAQLKAQLEEVGYQITYHTDTEVMMHFINREMRGDEPPDFKTLCANIAAQFDGAYSIAFINALGELMAMRDPLGIKPLCYGVRDNLLVFASESVVLTNLGMDQYAFLQPGEVLVANREGWRVERYAPPARTAHCYFEWVYFANLGTNLDGRSVYKVRQAVGRELAAMEPIQQREGFLVVPVPETANTVANAFAFHLGLPVDHGLLRNRYVGRTFIDGNNRSDAVRMKFTPMREVLEGKRIFLVDDTLVRGTTLRAVISSIREQGGAREVHVRIGCPPIMGPCFYGIDMPTVKELFAPPYLAGQAVDRVLPGVLQRMARELGADSLAYLSMEGLLKALELPRQNLCMACITSEYPTAMGRDRYLEAKRDAGFQDQPRRAMAGD